jgi:hypothetical protein
VIGLLARGYTNRQIADELVISERTVDGHVTHILTKLDLSSRAQAAAWAVQQGSLPLGMVPAPFDRVAASACRATAWNSGAS